MRHTLPVSPQFYVTAPQPCPYLPDREERKLFTTLDVDSALELNDALSHQGFRRSQNVIYRPSCSDCNACKSARVDVQEFKPSKSQKRVLRRNQKLVRTIKRTWVTEEHYALFSTYLNSRHENGGMAGMEVEEFSAMVEESPVNTQLVEYTLDDKLVAVCLTDTLTDGLSMVYSFFKPKMARNSIGTYMILDHIRIAQQVGMAFVYLGYWVQNSPKMDYKSKFMPLQTFQMGQWKPIDLAASNDAMPNEPIPEQVAAIHLPHG